MSLRKKFTDSYGDIPNDYEVHHIVPRHDGGTDDMNNLIPLSKEMHKAFHLDRYNKLGDFRDLCAYHMIGYNFSEAHKISSSFDGKVGGNKVKEIQVGILDPKYKDERIKWASLGGKAAQATLKEKQLSSFYNPELRLKAASAGGKVGAFTMPEIQRANGKKGGANNKGFVWLSNKKISIKYTAKMQQDKSTEDFLRENSNFKRGRLKNNENKIN